MAVILTSDAVNPPLAAQIAVLLSRAFTEDARLARYTDDERARWAADVARVRAAAPAAGEAMPHDWLERFPTMRDLWLHPEVRRRGWHLLEAGDGYVAAHVALFEHTLRIGRGRPFAAGFIEDVATDPLDLGRGFASDLMAAATDFAEDAGYPLVGLSTAIPAFYERLGWRRWAGEVAFAMPADISRVIDRAMFLPLSPRGRRLLARGAGRPIAAGPARPRE